MWLAYCTINKSANQISSLVNRKLNRSIRSINETTTTTTESNVMLTTHNPKDDDIDNDDDNIFDNKELFPDNDVSLICDDIEFECKSDHKCIPLESFCDGVRDCVDESDESSCATTPAIHFSIVTTTVSTTTSEKSTTSTEKSTTSTEKPTSVSPVDTIQQNTTLKPTARNETDLNATSTEQSITTTTLKVLWNNFLRHTPGFRSISIPKSFR